MHIELFLCTWRVYQIFMCQERLEIPVIPHFIQAEKS